MFSHYTMKDLLASTILKIQVKVYSIHGKTHEIYRNKNRCKTKSPLTVVNDSTIRRTHSRRPAYIAHTTTRP